MSAFFQKYSGPVYGFLIAFIVLTVGALLFAGSFGFLQSKQQSTDPVSGKCPSKCCKACSLNMPLTLFFAAGIGAATALVVALLQKQHREQILQLIGRSSTGANLPTPK